MYVYKIPGMQGCLADIRFPALLVCLAAMVSVSFETRPQQRVPGLLLLLSNRKILLLLQLLKTGKDIESSFRER